MASADAIRPTFKVGKSSEGKFELSMLTRYNLAATTAIAFDSSIDQVLPDVLPNQNSETVQVNKPLSRWSVGWAK